MTLPFVEVELDPLVRRRFIEVPKNGPKYTTKRPSCQASIFGPST